MKTVVIQISVEVKDDYPVHKVVEDVDRALVRMEAVEIVNHVRLQ
jgi:hypothetical protein